MGIVMGPDNVREETLRRMMTRYKNDLMRMCVAYLKDAALAEDAVQESFLRITENIDKYEKNTNACAWVCRIVHNTAVNELKKYKGKEYYPIDETEFFSDEESMEKKSESRHPAHPISQR